MNKIETIWPSDLLWLWLKTCYFFLFITNITLKILILYYGFLDVLYYGFLKNHKCISWIPDSFFNQSSTESVFLTEIGPWKTIYLINTFLFFLHIFYKTTIMVLKEIALFKKLLNLVSCTIFDNVWSVANVDSDNEYFIKYPRNNFHDFFCPVGIYSLLAIQLVKLKLKHNYVSKSFNSHLEHSN